MASLLKPECCSKCQSKNLIKTRLPEKWTCLDCSTVVAERPSKKMVTGICRKCQKSNKEVEFKPKKNLCIKCANEIHRKWSNDNRDRLRAYRSTVDFKKKRQIAVAKAIRRSPEAFITYLITMLRKPSNLKFKKIDKIKVVLVVEITADYMTKINNVQGGKCAITGVPMVFAPNSLFSASIDRIDSKIGYIPGNVHLVCLCINHAKRHHSLDSFKEAFRVLAASYLEQQDA